MSTPEAGEHGSLERIAALVLRVAAFIALYMGLLGLIWDVSEARQVEDVWQVLFSNLFLVATYAGVLFGLSALVAGVQRRR